MIAMFGQYSDTFLILNPTSMSIIIIIIIIIMFNILFRGTDTYIRTFKNNIKCDHFDSTLTFYCPYTVNKTKSASPNTAD